MNVAVWMIGSLSAVNDKAQIGVRPVPLVLDDELVAGPGPCAKVV